MKSSSLRLVALLILLLGGVACQKKSGDAVVVGKEHIAALKEGQKVTDSRATDNEQWIVGVNLINGGRHIDVRATKSQFQKLKRGDRVKVVYHVGKYSDTVWDAEIR